MEQRIFQVSAKLLKQNKIGMWFLYRNIIHKAKSWVKEQQKLLNGKLWHYGIWTVYSEEIFGTK